MVEWNLEDNYKYDDFEANTNCDQSSDTGIQAQLMKWKRLFKNRRGVIW